MLVGGRLTRGAPGGDVAGPQASIQALDRLVKHCINSRARKFDMNSFRVTSLRF